MTKVQGQFTSGTNSIAQRVTKAAWKWILPCYPACAPISCAAATWSSTRSRRCPDGCNRPQGAFYVLPDVSSDTLNGSTIRSSVDLCLHLLDSANVSIVEGDSFGAPGTVRISYATSDDKLVMAIDRIAKAITARPTNPKDAFDRFAGTTALVVGDVMLDAYLWGRVERISPEAPVPVVHVTERSERAGGAANVALNMRSLGANPVVVSMIGNDIHADQLDRLFTERGLSTQGSLRSPQRRTTVKTRVISGHQHIVRVDEEIEADLPPADERSLLAHIGKLIAEHRPGVIVLEDYNKGVLTEACDRRRDHAGPCERHSHGRGSEEEELLHLQGC